MRLINILIPELVIKIDSFYQEFFKGNKLLKVEMSVANVDLSYAEILCIGLYWEDLKAVDLVFFYDRFWG